LDALLLLEETAEPYLTVGMGVGKHPEEEWWALKVKVYGTDKRGHKIKGRGSKQRRRAEKRNAFDTEIDPIHNQIG
jgi:hypothetical protein